MPFTPFHMGPGLLLKGLLQGSFSLMVFGWAQIVMDLQPLIAMVTGEGELHGFTHTYLGATLLAVISALSGRYLGEFGLRLAGLRTFLPIGWGVATVSAFIGCWSHVLLDSIMHHDVEPLWPFSSTNVLVALLSVENLHWLCIGSGLAGAWLYLALERDRKRDGNRQEQPGKGV